MRRSLMRGQRRPSPSLIISLIALFVALGGTTYAATGDALILGHSNSASKSTSLRSSAAKHAALRVADTAGKPAASFRANAGVPPISVSNDRKIARLNADKLDGRDSSQFVRGGGLTVAGRTTLVLGGGGLQHIATVPGFGEVVGGCGSGGAAVGFVNHSGHDLRVYPFAGGDLTPVTFSDGTSSGLFPPGVGGAGYTLLQIGSTDFTDQAILTVVASRDAQVSNHCDVQAWAVTR
jgi:hypothetical protein